MVNHVRTWSLATLWHKLPLPPPCEISRMGGGKSPMAPGPPGAFWGFFGRRLPRQPRQEPGWAPTRARRQPGSNEPSAGAGRPTARAVPPLSARKIADRQALSARKKLRFSAGGPPGGPRGPMEPMPGLCPIFENFWRTRARGPSGPVTCPGPRPLSWAITTRWHRWAFEHFQGKRRRQEGRSWPPLGPWALRKIFDFFLRTRILGPSRPRPCPRTEPRPGHGP